MDGVPFSTVNYEDKFFALLRCQLIFSYKFNKHSVASSILLWKVGWWVSQQMEVSFRLFLVET